MTSPEFAAFVGIDWGDQKHAVCLVADGVESERELPHRAAEIDTWANELRTRFHGRLVAVCVEQSRGPLIYALLKYEFFVLFPVNPKHSVSRGPVSQWQQGRSCRRPIAVSVLDKPPPPTEGLAPRRRSNSLATDPVRRSAALRRRAHSL